MNAPAPLAESLNILTFNVGLLDLKAWGWTILKPTNYVEERLACLVPAILSLNADLIGLQEVYLKAHQTFLIQELRGNYPFFCFKRIPFAKLDNGLMIFSKRPISQVEYHPFREKRPFDERFVAQKGFLTCIVEWSKKTKIRIINLHPTSGGFFYKQDHPAIIRFRHRQIEQTYRFVEKESKMPVIILGDFNAGREIGVENYLFLIQKGFVDTYADYCERNAVDLEMTWDAEILLNQKGGHPNAISQRIDHIYISPDFAKSVQVQYGAVVFQAPCVTTAVGQVHLSDHYGVAVSLGLPL